MEDAGYLFDNSGEATPTRFAGLESLWDDSTIRYLSNIGVDVGWACWEVGAGGGSIARWLAERVAPTGTVLATDLDLTRIPEGGPSNLTFVRHDVVHDPIPTAEYDLVHARLVLVHLPEREEVLRVSSGRCDRVDTSSSRTSTSSSTMAGSRRRPMISCIAVCIGDCRSFFTGEAPTLATRVDCPSCCDRRA